MWPCVQQNGRQVHTKVYQVTTVWAAADNTSMVDFGMH